MNKFIKKLQNKENLNFEESKSAFNILMEGKASDQEIFDFLTLLSIKGEVSDEIAGGVHVLRNKSKRVNVKNCVDTCGTGGDGKNTLNISTASALLLASMGIKVAKHGNKALSSKCGSGDVLEALNIKINLEPKDVENQYPISTVDSKSQIKYQTKNSNKLIIWSFFQMATTGSLMLLMFTIASKISNITLFFLTLFLILRR